MEQHNIVNTTKSFESFREKAETLLYNMFPQSFDSGNIHGVYIGKQNEVDPKTKGGHRIPATPSTMSSALYFATADSMMDNRIIANEDAKRATFEKRIDETLAKMAAATVQNLVAKGVEREKAEQQVLDSLETVGWYDKSKGKFIIERVSSQVKDSILAGMAVPYWNISVIQKVFKQPFLEGYATRLVSPQAVPNVWADLVQIFTETFEGQARVSAVAKGTGEFNNSVGVKNRINTMISDVVNLVIDYESPTPNEIAITNEIGNIVGGQLIGDRDAYANLMLKVLKNSLYYFGSPQFDGLYQIADRDASAPGSIPTMYLYPNTPLNTIWDAEMTSNTAGLTTGAKVVKAFVYLFGQIMESLNFMPVSVRIACSPTVYKVLKFVLTSDAFVQDSPLSFINKAFEYNGKVVGTMATKGLDSGWGSFEILPDPMLAANTIFNSEGYDLMFITFPEWQSALEPNNITDAIIAPVLIENMILPSAPGYRDGIVRTAMTRIGSILAPIERSVFCIKGFGVRP
ncbi:MAG: hypothetical protein KBG49_10960 [Spirochaetes bacterium]|nr:hypothetical protein [Spirochaetota bacterium]